MARWVVLVLLLTVWSGSVGVAVERILSGEEVSSGKGYVVSLQYGVGSLVCSGVLVGKHLVLTAAHCLYPRGSKGLEVCSGGNCVKVRQTTVPEGYKQGKINYGLDLAMLLIERELTGIEPVSLLLEGEIKPQTKVNALGYGVHNVHQRPDEKLRKVDMVVKENLECRILVLDGVTGEENLLCGDGNHDRSNGGACDGDSGGPLILENSAGGDVVIGTASYVQKYGGKSLALPNGNTYVTRAQTVFIFFWSFQKGSVQSCLPLLSLAFRILLLRPNEKSFHSCFGFFIRIFFSGCVCVCLSFVDGCSAPIFSFDPCTGRCSASWETVFMRLMAKDHREFLHAAAKMFGQHLSVAAPELIGLDTDGDGNWEKKPRKSYADVVGTIEFPALSLDATVCKVVQDERVDNVEDLIISQEHFDEGSYSIAWIDDVSKGSLRVCIRGKYGFTGYRGPVRVWYTRVPSITVGNPKATKAKVQIPAGKSCQEFVLKKGFGNYAGVFPTVGYHSPKAQQMGIQVESDAATALATLGNRKVTVCYHRSIHSYNPQLNIKCQNKVLILNSSGSIPMVSRFPT